MTFKMTRRNILGDKEQREVFKTWAVDALCTGGARDQLAWRTRKI